MGAYDFRTMSLGKTAADAFRSATEQARWTDGHGGYTGTIAEKHDYGEVRLPPGLRYERLMRLVDQAQTLDYDIRDAQDATRYGTKRQRLAAARRLERLRAKRTKLFAGKPQTERAVEQILAAYADKWGPAACVEVTGKAARDYKARQGRAGTRDRVFVFIGSASS